MMNTSNGFPLLVTQYHIEGHPTRTEHWSLVVMVNASDGQIHELRGNYDTFTYVFETKIGWKTSAALCGGCLVGYIPPSTLPRLPEILREVAVVKNDSRFDYQTWIVLALRVLKEKGIVFGHMNKQKLRYELVVDMERDETGHDLVYERIVAGEI